MKLIKLISALVTQWAIFTIVLQCIPQTRNFAAANESESENEPFSFGDSTWTNGSNRQTGVPKLLKNDFLSISLYLDTYYSYSWNRPKDHTKTGSGTIGRTNEFQVSLASISFNANYKGAIARLGLQLGDQLSLIQDLDSTVYRGRNLSISNLKYIREAAIGYHWDLLYGINAEVGIFPSYIGLESYLTQENWNYQRSFASDFTPFYFQGARLQIYPRRDLRTELWLINGFQSYGKFNESNSIGLSAYYHPLETLATVANFYYGSDTQQNPEAKRFHHDHSIQLRYWSSPRSAGVSKAAFSLNNHYGFQNGGGYDLSTAYFLSSYLANRIWFGQDRFALTLRTGTVTNPSSYLFSLFNGSKDQPTGKDFRAWDYTATLDYMPNEALTLRTELSSRHSSVPFFSGADGTTNANGGWGSPDPNFIPDLRTSEVQGTLAASFRL